MWFGGVPATFHIVGRIIDPQYGAEVLAYGRDTLADEGAAAPIGFVSLVLRPGVTPAAAAARLTRASGGSLDAAVVPNPADQLGIVHVALAGLIAVLVFIAVTSLLTASLLGYRDHERDVGVLRAMGLTPLQVRGALMMRTTVLAGGRRRWQRGRQAGEHDADQLGVRLYGLGAGSAGCCPPARWRSRSRWRSARRRWLACCLRGLPATCPWWRCSGP